MDRKLSILKEYWKHDFFRPVQESIIDAVLAGEDTLALLPTGGGKSVCFQVPALIMPGLCLVVSPLIALMKDQVENLRKKNITAFSIHSGMNRKEVISTLHAAGQSNCKFLYVSPERLETSLFQEYLPSLGVNLIAVDEAHCISQWGYDFRPSYLKIADLRSELPGIPVLALTASATEEVQEDIRQKLKFQNPRTFLQSFSRPNLSFSAFSVPSRINKILDIVSKVAGTGIVYCKSRRRTREISDLLNKHGIPAACYHAGLTALERSARQEAWQRDEVRIIVSTNAFGMGIDKSNVRFVIHADTPDCLENYYQEAGRAGRDGKKSYAILLYDDEEIEALKTLPEQRFPQLNELRRIYGALMNFLQIPSGYGEGSSYDFDLNSFVKQFGIDQVSTAAALRCFEQEELLQLNEQVFSPAKLQVTASRESLETLGAFNPTGELLVKTLLRTYSGIFDQPVNIFEGQLAFLLHCHTDVLYEQLLELHKQGLVQYSPQKEKPQLYLMHNRTVAGELHINMENYRSRKQKFQRRVEAMIDFAYPSTLCRSVFIGNYFGDSKIKPCGICDNCLSNRKSATSPAEFDLIHKTIMGHLTTTPLTLNDLIATMRGTPRDKMMEVLRFLEAENRIRRTDQGLLVPGS